MGMRVHVRVIQRLCACVCVRSCARMRICVGSCECISVNCVAVTCVCIHCLYPCLYTANLCIHSARMCGCIVSYCVLVFVYRVVCVSTQNGRIHCPCLNTIYIAARV